jgi:hypothetical protein
MESLIDFEWHRMVDGYRLACLPKRGRSAYWITDPGSDWAGRQDVDRSAKLEISTTEYQGEKRVARAGVYIAGRTQTLNKGKPDEMSRYEIMRPFEGNELVSLNLLRAGRTPKTWLEFTNKYGMIGHVPLRDRWHMFGKDKQHFICEVEHEGEWHHLTSVLSQIYNDHPAIENRDKSYLSKIIKWESDDIVREDRGIKIGSARVQMAIAMRGKYQSNSHYFEHMRRPDVFTPAAFALRDRVNRYLEKSVSLEISFDPKTLKFSSSLRYGSLGAALVAEAIEFMAGHFEARQCAVCGSWFRIGTNQMRKDRKFCSAACKMRDYRARKSDASHDRGAD